MCLKNTQKFMMLENDIELVRYYFYASCGYIPRANHGRVVKDLWDHVENHVTLKMQTI